MLTDTRKSPNARLQGLPFSDVEWTHGLYKERFDTCAGSTVPHLQNMFERREISHVLENFRIAAGDADGDFDGTVFGDGDFYKWMEAAVYTAVRTDNRELLAQLEDYIALIGRAQQPDGYISTKQIIGERSERSRLGDINDFEVIISVIFYQPVFMRLTGKTAWRSQRRRRSI
ncbi:MAG: beta-L-arabinofuranosidase domain-containing protein [Eisenbergiella massiliensis]